MNLLQIRAYLPEKGEVNLLASPPLDEAAQLLSGTGADANGAKSLAMGAAIEVPWASRISGSSAPDGGDLITVWHGMRLNVPMDTNDSRGTGSATATGGMLLKQPSDSVTTNIMPDGGEAQAIFRPGNFNDHWPSKTVITTTVMLSGRAIDMKIVARNMGDTAEPVGIGWHPRFAILNGHRGQMMLRLPQGMRVEVKDRRTGQLSGKLLPVEGTEYDFTGRDVSAAGCAES